MMRIRANGIAMHYELEGPADAPLVTFSHSLATSAALWAPQAAALKDRFRVLRYDVRGHGNTEVPPGPYTFEHLAGDVHALLQALGCGSTHFVGLSNGGMVGQHLALAHPEAVKSLVLCDTTSRPPAAMLPVWEDRARTAETVGMEPLVEPTIERWFTPVWRERDPATVERFRDLIRNTSPQGYAACCRAIRQVDVTARLHTLDIPTLILVGEEDRGTTVEEHQIIHREIPGSQLVVFEATAHLSNLGATDRFNAALIDFLQRQEGGAR